MPDQLTDRPDLALRTAPADLLADVLAAVRLSGAIFLRGEYTAPWAYESPPPDVVAHLLQRDAKRLILFHIVAEGRCWIGLTRGEQLEASEGEVVVRALPPLFTVRPPAGPAAAWVAASIRYALDASEGSYSFPPGIAVRLPELLFSEVLRLYLASDPPPRTGWLTALRDPVVGPAQVERHTEPARKWTLEELARRTACSRSVLTERFRRLLGRAPMQYLGQWRLQVAAGLLRDTPLGVAAVAYRVGYESEEAFNRAFKRAVGRPPAQWRQHAAGE